MEASMFSLLAVILALNPARAAMDGETAVAKARTILASLGVHDSLSLQGLRNEDYTTKEPCWSVWFNREKGSIRIVLNSETGRVLFVQANPVPDITHSNSQPPSKKSTDYGRKLLLKLGYEKDTILSVERGYAIGSFSAIF